MFESLQILKAAYKTGKLHQKLITRIGILTGIIVLATIALLYDVFIRNLPLLPILIFSCFGFFFGYYVMSKMRNVTWHEHEEVLTIAALDIAGILILLLYLLVRILADRYLSEQYSDTFHVSGYALAFFWGIMFGRLFGIIKRIEVLFRNT